MYKRKEQIGDCTLYLGDCLEVMPTLDKVDHIICDPPYESLLHEASKKLSQGRFLKDKRNPFKEFNFDIACKRVEDAYRQPDMLLEQEKREKVEYLQENLDVIF